MHPSFAPPNSVVLRASALVSDSEISAHKGRLIDEVYRDMTHMIVSQVVEKHTTCRRDDRLRCGVYELDAVVMSKADYEAHIRNAYYIGLHEGSR